MDWVIENVYTITHYPIIHAYDPWVVNIYLPPTVTELWLFFSLQVATRTRPFTPVNGNAPTVTLSGGLGKKVSGTLFGAPDQPPAGGVPKGVRFRLIVLFSKQFITPNVNFFIFWIQNFGLKTLYTSERSKMGLFWKKFFSDYQCWVNTMFRPALLRILWWFNLIIKNVINLWIILKKITFIYSRNTAVKKSSQVRTRALILNLIFFYTSHPVN